MFLIIDLSFKKFVVHRLSMKKKKKKNKDGACTIIIIIIIITCKSVYVYG